MVLGRSVKAYKKLMRTMVTHLFEYQNIETTLAKAKRLQPHARKLLKFARRAEKGEKSPMNLLKGRLFSLKAYRKLLLEIVPRLRNIPCHNVNVSPVLHRRRGDNAPIVRISILGNEKSKYQKMMRKEALERGEIVNMRMYKRQVLNEERQHYEQLMVEHPEMSSFFQQKLARIDYEDWLSEKSRHSPPKFTLLV